ncbi:sialoadhesin-like [Paramisgurnus dabryanus]|uniref:sialoadhesin-like n=1 Tax=Paramisgurnus dabryanus TaxID=90735 RepID=UPI003CCF38D1
METCFRIFLMLLLMIAVVDGQQELEVNYSPSYVCALRGSTVRITCTLKNPSHHVIDKTFWTKVGYVPDEEPPNLCLDPEYRRRVLCRSKDQDTHSITLTDVTETDKRIYYCRFITDRVAGKWPGIPGVQLDVTDLQVETKQRVKEGDSVTLTCKTTCSLPEETTVVVTGHHSSNFYDPLPHPLTGGHKSLTNGVPLQLLTTFIWYRNLERFTKGITTWNQLHLRSVSRDDLGVYRCDAVRGYEHLLSSPDVFLWVDVVRQQDWEVNYSPSNVCALRGSTVRITCTLKYPSDHVVNKAFWTKFAFVPGAEPPNLCLDPDNRRGVQCQSKDQDTHSITLTDVTEADKHIYYCRFITDKEKGKYSGVPGVQLDVTDLQVETKQIVKEGDSVTLTCKTTCSLPEETTLIWYRNTQRFTKGIITLNQLHLRSVSRDDSGDYRCAAVRGSELLLSSPDVYLSVELVSQQDWEVNYSPSYVCALRGSIVRITSALKYPSDHVVNKTFWTKVANVSDEEPPDLCLDPEDRRRIQCYSENNDTHSITLTDVTEADKRIYYCRFITDRVGGKWSGVPGVQLDVTDLQVETKQRVQEGDSVTLTCKTTCSLPEETTFIWYRNTQRFTKGIKTLNQLHLRSVSRDDLGVYRCDAVRGYELLLSSRDVFLWVDLISQQGWGVNYSPSYVCALRGSTVRITCTLKYPSHHVVNKAFWTKVAFVLGGEPPNLCLDPESRRGVQCQSKDQDTHSITLTDVTEADKHIYYCRFITDRGGKWSGIPGVQLDVTDLQVETNQRVKEGDSVTLTCKTTCSLPEETTFIWYRNKQRFTKGIKTLIQLHLRSVSRDDSGVYRCVAAVREYELLSSPGVYLIVEWDQGSTLYNGIVAGCVGLFFIIVIFIILFIWKKRRDRQNQANGSSYVSLFTLASKSADVDVE